MLSNRESARRSRKRKQEQLQELEGQIETLEKKTASLESQCQAAAVHVQKLMTDKQQLENENQHLMSIFQQLQVRSEPRAPRRVRACDALSCVVPVVVWRGVLSGGARCVQKSLGKDTIRMHLPAALAGPPPGENVAAPEASPRNGRTADGGAAAEGNEPDTGRGKRARESADAKGEPEPAKSRRSAAKKA